VLTCRCCGIGTLSTLASPLHLARLCHYPPSPLTDIQGFISSSWHVTNNGTFAASCIGAAALSIVLEYLRRWCKDYDALILRQLSVVNASNDIKHVKRRATFVQQLVRAVMHAVTLGVAYLLMLIVMSYNGYLIISIFIGAGIGKFLGDWLELTPGNAPQSDECATMCCG
jgi:copper transporter 1